MGRLIVVFTALLAFKSGECNQFCRVQGLESGRYADKYCVCVKSFKYSELSKPRYGLPPVIDHEEESKPIFRLDDTWDFTD